MIGLTNLTKSYGAKALFRNVNLQFDPGKCYGIVGANGAGKSTLMRILAGQETPDKGEINLSGKLRLGTLNQDHFAFEDVIIMDVVLQGQKELYAAFQEKEALLNSVDPDGHRISELEEIIARHDGYVAESRIGEMLEGLGIPEDKHTKTMSVLSGGYKLRVLLAQCLFSQPDVLLLDEPTNHLDILSIGWLEQYLRQMKGLVIIVSHDREFLNNVCTHIADVDYETINIYTGNYDQYLTAKAMDEDMRRQQAEKAEKKINELQDFVTRFKAKASKARQAQSKVKQIERMEKGIEDPVYSSRVFPRIKFTPCRPPGKRVLEVDGLSKSFGSHKVLNDISFTVYRDDKVAILGPNGVGKSTLLKVLMGELACDGGSYEWGHETYPEYFSQDHHEALGHKTTPFEWLYQYGPGESIGTIRGILGNLLFSGDDVEKSTTALSGGEAARLVLAKLVLKQGNILVLDEPTNHLDMESIESLVQAIQDFEGTVLLVSHNRYVVDRVATKILEIRHGAVDLFDGTYKEFLSKHGFDHLSYQAQISAATKSTKKSKGKREKEQEKKKVSQDAKKVFRVESKMLVEQNAMLEVTIERLEQEIEVITDLFSDPSYFAQTKPEEVRKKDLVKKDLEGQLEKAMEQWAAVNEELDALRTKHGLA